MIMSSVHKKKEAFNCLLSQELSNCKHIIEARYDWQTPDQVFSFCLKNERTIQISINLNCSEELLFANNKKKTDLTIFYRAFFINAYIRYIEDAFYKTPNSYNEGLVTICAINSLCKKRGSVSASSVTSNRYVELSPIDVFCAIRALTRMLIDFRPTLSTEEQQQCEILVDYLLSYSLMPEVAYHKGKPVYSLPFEMKKTQHIIDSNKGLLQSFPLMKDVDFTLLREMTRIDVVEMLNHTKHPFWVGAALRLALYAHDGKGTSLELFKLHEDTMRMFKEDCSRFCIEIRNTNSTLLRDDYNAIKRLVANTEEPAVQSSAEYGSFHYYK